MRIGIIIKVRNRRHCIPLCSSRDISESDALSSTRKPLLKLMRLIESDDVAGFNKAVYELGGPKEVCCPPSFESCKGLMSERVCVHSIVEPGTEWSDKPRDKWPESDPRYWFSLFQEEWIEAQSSKTPEHLVQELMDLATCVIKGNLALDRETSFMYRGLTGWMEAKYDKGRLESLADSLSSVAEVMRHYATSLASVEEFAGFIDGEVE